jgi:GTP-binding protein YchF
MSLQIGIVGLPNAGKSTLFNALVGSSSAKASEGQASVRSSLETDVPTEAAAKVGNFPFTTIDPNVGVVDVPDARLQQLANLVQPAKITPATVQFVDIAGIVKGASTGEGLGNKFLANIREVDAIAIVVRAFEDATVIHVAGKVDPADDLSVLITELLLADLESLEQQIKLTEGKIKSGEKDAATTLAVLNRLKSDIEAERVPRLASFSDDEQKLVKRANLLTTKPFIVAPNVAETDLAHSSTPGVEELRRVTDSLLGSQTPIIPISAKIEAELSDLDPNEQAAYLAELGVKESSLVRLVRTAYATLGFQTYFTAGPKEVRAWTIHRGDSAPQAAGVIHGDFERGFIAAETVRFEQFVADGGWAGAKAAGHVRTEGRTYRVDDGDVLLFRFNV